MHPNHVRCANVDEGPCDKLTSSLFAELHSTASWTSLKSKFLYWYVIHARESTLNASSLDETVWYQRMQSVFRQLSKMPTDSTGTPGIRDSPQPLEGSRLTCPKFAVNWSFYMPFRWLVTKKRSILKQIDALCEVSSRHLEWLWVCVCSSNSVRCQNQAFWNKMTSALDSKEGQTVSRWLATFNRLQLSKWRGRFEMLEVADRVDFEASKNLWDSEKVCGMALLTMKEATSPKSSQSPHELSASSFAPLDLIRTQSICLQNQHEANKSACYTLDLSPRHSIRPSFGLNLLIIAVNHVSKEVVCFLRGRPLTSLGAASGI
jgi:hypothetical protein